jgi:CBS domain-containing protein
MNAPQARDCMTRDVVTCRPETDMERAAHLMWTNDCGVLPVLGERDQVVGLVTDRDLVMGAYTRGRPLAQLHVEDSMSREVAACLPGDTLEDAIRTLGRKRVRRLPVIDEQGLLQGILSMNDAVRHVAATPESPVRARLAAALIESLASICGAREPAPAAPVPKPVKSVRASEALSVV